MWYVNLVLFLLNYTYSIGPLYYIIDGFLAAYCMGNPYKNPVSI